MKLTTNLVIFAGNISQMGEVYRKTPESAPILTLSIANNNYNNYPKKDPVFQAVRIIGEGNIKYVTEIAKAEVGSPMHVVGMLQNNPRQVTLKDGREFTINEKILKANEISIGTKSTREYTKKLDETDEEKTASNQVADSTPSTKEETPKEVSEEDHLSELDDVPWDEVNFG